MAVPAPSFGLRPAEAVCNLLPAVLVSELGEENEVDGTSATS
jgi:hypothetical protein